MEDYQKRVVEEREELEGKIERLYAFLGSASAVNTGAKEIRRLRLQVDYMASYSEVLRDRIAAFK